MHPLDSYEVRLFAPHAAQHRQPVIHHLVRVRLLAHGWQERQAVVAIERWVGETAGVEIREAQAMRPAVRELPAGPK